MTYPTEIAVYIDATSINAIADTLKLFQENDGMIAAAWLTDSQRLSASYFTKLVELHDGTFIYIVDEDLAFVWQQIIKADQERAEDDEYIPF